MVRTGRLPLVLLAIFALLNLYPVVSLVVGASPMWIFTPLTTLVGFAFALAHAREREGWRRALLLLALVFVVSLLFESVGVATGWFYGPYHYTDKLGPKFLGLVPLLIPVAWFMMSYPSFVIADRLVGTGPHGGRRLLAVASIGALVMTAWDLVMDPIMVFNGHWVWDVTGAYHGIPVQNFLGWWLTVFTTYALFQWISPLRRPAPVSRFDLQAVASYLVTALGLIFSCAVAGAGELVLIGIFTMFPWVIAAGMRIAGE